MHLAYFTAYVDDCGTYRTLPDLYGYDAPMRAALGLPGGGGPAIARSPRARPPARPERAAAPAKPRVVPRSAARRHASDDWANRRYERDSPRRAVRRAARADAAPEYGEPGLWTPGTPAPVSRGWW